jgi:DNA mismatch endonuclease (patch repair protein)
MADIVSPAVRSRMMSGIRGKNTKPEMRVRSYLHRCGLRFRLHSRDLPGSPDLVFPKYRAVVFVHGCFWHRHAGCSYAYTPKSNVDQWTAKFSENKLRDEAVRRRLLEMGWRIFVIWECQLRTTDNSALDGLVRELRSCDTPLNLD